MRLRDLRRHLVDDCHDWHRWWSFRFTGLITLIQFVPSKYVLELISALPDDVQSLIPGRRAVITVLALAALGARLLKQKKKGDDNGDDT